MDAQPASVEQALPLVITEVLTDGGRKRDSLGEEREGGESKRGGKSVPLRHAEKMCSVRRATMQECMHMRRDCSMFMPPSWPGCVLGAAKSPSRNRPTARRACHSDRRVADRAVSACSQAALAAAWHSSA